MCVCVARDRLYGRRYAVVHAFQTAATYPRQSARRWSTALCYLLTSTTIPSSQVSVAQLASKSGLGCDMFPFVVKVATVRTS